MSTYSVSMLDYDRWLAVKALRESEGITARKDVAARIGCSVNSLNVSVCRARNAEADAVRKGLTWSMGVGSRPNPLLSPPEPEPTPQPEPQPEPAPEPWRPTPQNLARVPKPRTTQRTSMKDLRAAAEPYVAPTLEPDGSGTGVRQSLTLPPDVPPMSNGAMEHVKSMEHLQQIIEAYERPAVRLPSGEGYFRQWAGTVELVVADHDQTIVSITEHLVDDGYVSPLGKMPGGSKKSGKSGGSGQLWPTDRKELERRLKAAGCEWDMTGGGHVKIVAPNGAAYTTASTPSDYRAMANFCTDFRRATGIDLRWYARGGAMRKAG